MYDDESEKDKGKLGKEWTDKMIEATDQILENKESYESTPLFYFSKNIQNIILNNNLPENYEQSIKLYIMYGQITWVPTKSFAIIPDIKNKQTVTIKIFQKLTDKNLVEIKKLVNKQYGENLPPFIKGIKNIDAKIATEKYVNERDFFDEDEKKPTAKDIVKNVKIDTGKKIKESEVYDMPRRLNKIRKNRFKKSGT